jgi:hypothetical protein
MKQGKKDLFSYLDIFKQECDDEDRSTEFMIQYLQDHVGYWNENNGTNYDPFDTVMKFLETPRSAFA